MTTPTPTAPPVTRQLRVGVLGCAEIARRRMLPAMRASPATRVTAVASRDPRKAADFARRFGAQPVGGYQELLEREDVDAVYLPLPPALHADWIQKALAAGKHVLAEKPLSTSSAEAQTLVRAAQERDLVLMEGFMFLYHRQHAEVKALVDSGQIGEIRGFRAGFGFPPLPEGDIRYRPDLGGGALLDAGVYAVRAAQLFLGDQLRVLGSSRVQDENRGVDLSGTALLSTPTGVTAELSWGFDRSYQCTYELWGSEGHLVLQRAFTPPPLLPGSMLLTRGGSTEAVTLSADDQFGGLANAFARAVALRTGGATADPPEGLLEGAADGRISSGPAVLRQADLVQKIGELAVSYGRSAA